MCENRYNVLIQPYSFVLISDKQLNGLGIDSEYESVGSKSKHSYSSIPGNPNVRAVLARSENDEPPR